MVVKEEEQVIHLFSLGLISEMQKLDHIKKKKNNFSYVQGLFPCNVHCPS